MDSEFQNLDCNCISENECSFNLQPYINVQSDEQCTNLKDPNVLKEDYRRTDDASAHSGNIYNDQLAFFAEFINGVKYGFSRDTELRRSESHSKNNSSENSCNNSATVTNWSQNNYPCSVKQEHEPLDIQFNNNESLNESPSSSRSEEVPYTPLMLTSRLDSKLSLKSVKRLLDKDSDEYKKRRERNNIAVRKSREKAKQKSKDTERRVIELERDNEELRKRVEELRNQLNIFKKVLMKFGIQADALNLHQPKMTTSEQAHNFLSF